MINRVLLSFIYIYIYIYIYICKKKKKNDRNKYHNIQRNWCNHHICTQMQNRLNEIKTSIMGVPPPHNRRNRIAYTRDHKKVRNISLGNPNHPKNNYNNKKRKHYFDNTKKKNIFRKLKLNKRTCQSYISNKTNNAKLKIIIQSTYKFDNCFIKITAKM